MDSARSSPTHRAASGLTAPVLLTGAAVVLGVLTGLAPVMALALTGLAVVTALAFLAPVAHVLLLLGVTVLLPPEVQNQLGAVGGAGAASDALLTSGLARAALVLVDRRLSPRELLTTGLALVVLLAAGVQVLQGLAAGREAVEVLGEFRVIANLAGCVLIGLSLLDDAGQRRRMYAGLLVLALALGAWGVAQWALGLRFTGAEEALKNVDNPFLTAGRTVGLFAFPVAAVIALAALTSGRVRSTTVRLALVAAFVLNNVAIILTFERTFWAAAVIGMAFVVLNSRGGQRAKLLLVTPVLLIVLLVGLSALAPAEFVAARERLLSVKDYQQDNAIRYRVVESERVFREIVERPVAGSGFGAFIYIGRPGTRIAPKPRLFAENGYLWIAWKLGLPAAAVIILLFGLAVARRRRVGEPDDLDLAVRNGAQASLVALLAASVTFPSFSSVGATALMGILVAVCAAPCLARRPEPDDAPSAPVGPA